MDIQNLFQKKLLPIALLLLPYRQGLPTVSHYTVSSKVVDKMSTDNFHINLFFYKLIR